MTGKPSSYAGSAAAIWATLILALVAFGLGYLVGDGHGRVDCVEVDNVTFNVP